MASAEQVQHVFISAPPGAGKTRYARHLARQSRRWQGKAEGELSAIYRYAGLEAPKWWERGGPFRAPHHTVSEAGMTGVFREGWIIRPGELSLAHAGVLLLDEAAEFPRRVLEVIEQAARDGSVGFTGWSWRRTPARAGSMGNRCGCCTRVEAASAPRSAESAT
jgi:magnesium chelatase family protein